MDANSVKELREKTGAGFLECKKALEQHSGNMEKAMSYLRERGLAAAAKKADRDAKDGRVHAYIHGQGKMGVLLEVNCETDFVARTDDFQNFVNDVAMHIAAANPLYVDKDSVPEAEVSAARARFEDEAKKSGKPAAVVDKIVEGKLSKFFEEFCLLNQKFVKDPDKTVEEFVKGAIAKLGENIQVRRFSRMVLGETRKVN